MPAFKSKDSMPPHDVQTGESLASLAAANKITWQQLAEFNWGTRTPEIINLHTYNDVGSRKPKKDDDKPDPMANYSFTSGDKAFGTGQIKIPETYTKAGLAIDNTHVVRVKNYIAELQWTPREGVCGDKVKLTGKTNLPNGTIVAVEMKAKKGESPKLAGFNVAVSAGKIEFEWEIQDVGFKNGTDFLEWTVVEANAKHASVTPRQAYLTVNAMHEADEQTFDKNQSWSGFTNHSQFKQSMKKFRNNVKVHFDILKAWGGYWINLTSAGITGKAGGNPWNGHRWGRATGANAMAPNEYHDGTNWVPLPVGFTLTGTNHSAIGFFQQGTNFVSTSGGTYPGTFADYDFNSPTYTAKRQAWIDKTHECWTDKWHIKRKTCKSDAATRCCRYDVDVVMDFTTVAAHAEGVIAVCAGALRSNASIWFMDDTRLEMAAHEAGHHMDNPDEYTGGAVDTTLNGDGAVNGIDANCIMGQNLTTTKKRHYHGFVEMNGKLIKAKYGKQYDYEAVARA